jgi:predicted secreted protein
MNWVSGTVLYVMIWWISLFAVLPLGTRPAADADSVTGWRGTPTGMRLRTKALITTGVTTVLWLIAYALIEYDLLSFRHGILAE